MLRLMSERRKLPRRLEALKNLEVRPLEMTQRCPRTNSFIHVAAEVDFGRPQRVVYVNER